MKSLAQHVKSFEGVNATLMTISMDVSNQSESVSVKRDERIRDISDTIRDLCKRQVILIPATDGFVFLIDNGKEEDAAEATAQLAARAASSISANLGELAKFGAKPTLDLHLPCHARAAQLTHESFIAMPLEERYQSVLSALQSSAPPPLLFVRSLTQGLDGMSPIYAVPVENIGRGDIIRPFHRDKRFEVNPANLVADIALIRGVCAELSRKFKTGEMTQYYCTLNINTLRDPRYWAIYEIELRNVPGYYSAFIRWEVGSIAPGTPTTVMHSVVERLRAIDGSISLCHQAMVAINNPNFEFGLPKADELAFELPSGVSDIDAIKISDGLRGFVVKGGSRPYQIGLRNFRSLQSVELRQFRGGVFLDQTESRQRDLIESEFVYVR